MLSRLSLKYRIALVIFLLLTILLGLLFLGIKAVEYGEKFQHNLVPGPNFEFEGVEAELLGGSIGRFVEAVREEQMEVRAA